MRSLTCLLSVMTFCVVSLNGATQQANETHARASELTKRLNAAGPQSFAAAVPGDSSRFVAALHIPNVQLLVVSGRYPAPTLLRELLLKHDYQRVYLDLNAAAEREGRFFVEDLGGDGLRIDSKDNMPFDITWRNGTDRVLYNGAWKEQKLSETEYRDRFDKDAKEYADALQILVDAHAATATAQPSSRTSRTERDSANERMSTARRR
jgi:hypothetical protein